MPEEEFLSAHDDIKPIDFSTDYLSSEDIAYSSHLHFSPALHHGKDSFI